MENNSEISIFSISQHKQEDTELNKEMPLKYYISDIITGVSLENVFISVWFLCCFTKKATRLNVVITEINLK